MGAAVRPRARARSRPATTSATRRCSRRWPCGSSTSPLPPRSRTSPTTLVPFALDEATFRPGRRSSASPQPRTFRGYRRAGGPRRRHAQHHRHPRHHLAHGERRAPARRASAAARARASANSMASSRSRTPRAAGRASRTTPPKSCARSPASWCIRMSARCSPSTTASSRSPTRGCATFMREHDYPLDDVPHRSSPSAAGSPPGWPRASASCAAGCRRSPRDARTDEPLGGLRIALQCGGSDAFSGVSGNPLAGAIVHEVIRHGGTGVLSETDEAMGAEAYVLRNVRDLATARAFLGDDRALHERLVVARRHAARAIRPAATSCAASTTSRSNRSAPCTRRIRARALDHVIDYARAARPSRASLHEQPGQRPRGHRRAGRRRLQPDPLRHRQRLDHQFPVRADAEDHDDDAAPPAADPRDGHQRRPLPRRRADGRRSRRRRSS